MATIVNLDALIQREDFEIGEGKSPQQLVNTLNAQNLEKGKGFFYSSLRKPDFQRETSDWNKTKIVDFINSFINGDLIPSIILWNAGQYTFVIDGAHRLSALIAWVNDDYGDGHISQSFFNHDIDPEQKKLAEQTRKLIEKNIGSYSTYMNAIENPSDAREDILNKAQKLGILSMQLQWVIGSTKQAENSFFKINEKSTPISETEKSLLKSRNKPYAIASRAIMRAGTGHNYWSNFQEDNQNEIKKIAKEINTSLFTPEVKTPIKTLDLPLAGKNYSSRTLPLIFDLVKLSNKYNDNIEIEDDLTGSETIKNLKKTNAFLRRITTTHPSSLGLHPALYFYSENGRYQPTTLMAWIEILKEFESKKKFNDFIKVREKFEDYFITRKDAVNQITQKYGSGLKSYNYLKSFFISIIDYISDNSTCNTDDIDNMLLAKFNYLNLSGNKLNSTQASFSNNSKSAIFLKNAISKSSKCEICKGLIHVGSITIDHIERKQDGGKGTVDNGQLTHPYCNSTYKN